MIRTLFILLGTVVATYSNGMNHFPRFDGWYNNLFNAKWGTPGTAMFREVNVNNQDPVYRTHGTKSELPNARIVSEAFQSGEEGILSENGQSVMLTFFAQLIVDDILDTRRPACPTEYLNIRMPNASSNVEKIMPVYRSKFDKKSSSNFPRNLVNEATTWLDGSAIYGPSHSWSKHLREFRKGRLGSHGNMTEFPFFNNDNIPLINPTLDRENVIKRNPAELFSFGNARGNENIFLMTVEIIWFRYHNYLAQKFSTENPYWSDEKIFENARRWTVATYQKIALYEMLPALVNNYSVPKYKGYNSLLDPAITVEFSAAAMRIGHSMVPAGIALRRRNCSVVDPLPEDYMMSAGEPALRLCNTFWQLQDAILKHGIDDIVRGLTSQITEKSDYNIVEDLRNFLYGPLKRSRMDILAISIERGRDAGLASYNSVRQGLGLAKVTSFSEFTGVPEYIIEKVSEEYQNNTDLVELYIGGLLESSSNNIQSDSLFGRIITEQFIRLRDSDRYWFENEQEGYFSKNDIDLIRNISFRDVIVATTSIEEQELQRNVFLTDGSLCSHIPVVSSNFTRSCTPNEGMDLFGGYWGMLVGSIVFLIFLPISVYIVMLIIAKSNEKEQKKEKIAREKNVRNQSVRSIRKSINNDNLDVATFTGLEIEGENSSRSVVVTLGNNHIQILNSLSGSVLRNVSLEKFNIAYLLLSQNKGRTLMIIRVPKEYDVVIRFPGHNERDEAKEMVQSFLMESGVSVTCLELQENTLLEEAVTKEVRQQLLEIFFRRVFGEALNIQEPAPPKKRSIIPSFGRAKKNSSSPRDDVIDCELTEAEFADTLGMKPGSVFVTQMFQMADTDNSGYLSMREVADLIVLLMNGTPEQKVKMMFDMYDADKSGEISREEGRLMIKSFLEMASYSLKADEIDEAIDAIFSQSGVGEDGCLTEEMFTKVLMKDHRDAFANANLSLTGVGTPAPERKNGNAKSRKVPGEPGSSANTSGSGNENAVTNNAVSKPSENTVEDPKGLRNQIKIFKRFMENNRRHIFCVVVFYSITALLMIESASKYGLQNEHSGKRRISEWGTIISRSTAEAVSFHFSIILLTMCRNLITFCRETFLNNLIPFDAAVAFHKQIAYVALVETALHVIGHIINVYHLSVHPLPILACILPKILVDDGSDVPPSPIWWLYETITGWTGILLVAVMSIMYIFAMQYSRRFCFRAFWKTHHLFVLMYVLTILHGSLELFQSPIFYIYLIGPAFIYTIDQMITLSRSKVETSVVKAETLPSGVLNIVFKRPTGFDYRSGQWLRIACLSLGTNEYHPFTLTSAPHEEYLSVHIRAVGPWTTNLRRVYQEAIDKKAAYSKLYIDGPFGEGHQDWYKYEVAILVGAGIGVTPFASILKDIVQKYKTRKELGIVCKKVYFLWVTRSQRHFEWLTDIIRDLEEADKEELVETNIYITQFHHKFDLRTTMLYICERFFQKEANKSLFTGLKATTNFGRPQFETFFQSLQDRHPEVKQFGIFSCGPAGVTNGVDSSSKIINRRGRSQFSHFFENF